MEHLSSTKIQFTDYNLAEALLKKNVSNTHNIKQAISFYSQLETTTTLEENVKDIYLHILKMHDRKPFVFDQERIILYSEEDYIVKFWAFIFENFFGTDEHLFIHW